MSLYLPTWIGDQEPNQGNVRQWMQNLSTRLSPLEQCRWRQAQIDTLFYAGEQNYINSHFNFSPGFNYQNFYFNILQQNINLVTGYQRQHRKSFSYLPSEGSDPKTTDQYTKVITHIANTEGIHEQFSRGCEQSCITGMVLAQPYLDFTGSDPAQGQLKLKIWEFNSFMIDPYCRDMNNLSDCQIIWCQEFITKQEAMDRFGEKAMNVTPIAPGGYSSTNFYFLPENYNIVRTDMLVLSYVWYKWKRKKKMLYSKKRNQFFDFAGGQEQMDQILYNIPDLEAATVETPTWKLAVVLNDRLMFQGENPLHFDDCPFIMIPWNYEPHNNVPDLRVRGLVRTMRSANFLLSRQIIISHDQKESTINSGYKRKQGAVANEDNLKKTGQGWDVIINEGYEMTDFEKIQPNAVPESDFALADRLQSLIFATSGVDMENWSAQNDNQASALTTMLKQAANLLVLQKYFDQWDMCLKTLGDRMLQIVLNNWSAEKVGLIIGEDPTPYFYSKVFAKYQTIVEEGILTATQQNMQAQTLMDINAAFGREVFPPSMIIKNLTIQGKAEAMEFLQQQEQMASAVQEHTTNVQHVIEQAKLKEIYAKTANQIAMAQERHGRNESNIGLFEERLSEVSKNQALSTKAKMEALEKLMDVISKYGEIETLLKENQIQSYDYQEDLKQNAEKENVKRSAAGNEFVSQMLSGTIG